MRRKVNQVSGWMRNEQSWKKSKEQLRNTEEKEQRNKPTLKCFNGKLGERKRGNSNWNKKLDKKLLSPN